MTIVISCLYYYQQRKRGTEEKAKIIKEVSSVSFLVDSVHMNKEGRRRELIKKEEKEKKKMSSAKKTWKIDMKDEKTPSEACRETKLKG